MFRFNYHKGKAFKSEIRRDIIFKYLIGKKPARVLSYEHEFNNAKRIAQKGESIPPDIREKKLYGFPLIRVMADYYEEHGELLTLRQSFQHCVRDISRATRW
ncbi:hypothetical protein [Pontibacillus yanchengensis]|uniref:Uncharacterized protein n=1 Tax=Pontibacillus yanchengensis Y32 TaxID=1385514 RepID=A0A0A2TFU1_9BACI|nr:hypothetical protein [Pontibacillus yanchengensis]KGP73303.1 hypothetical protein N782_06465 [Pontibacillus yanchengensis Y32]